MLNEEARSLIRRLHEAYHPVYGFSTTSCQIYDTAWVAMISKIVDGRRLWLFPESFQYLLENQAEDGSWGQHPRTKSVGVVDTAAALLALLRHVKEPLQLQYPSPSDMHQRIDRARKSLCAQLAMWDDIMMTNHIGVELTVPALLTYLKSEDSSLSFDFESKELLMSMRTAKLARFNFESFYQRKPSSAIHSLEAFVTQVDFDKVAHHLFNGSMLASPSSTAAYLMHASSWDDAAEGYLRHVFSAGAGQGGGGIPGTHPTSYFEFNWVIATLLQAGFTTSDLNCRELHSIANIIISGFQGDHGVLGFAPRAIDVDDTAKGLLALSLLQLDADVSAAPMISIFEAEDHFRTFLGERDPSFTSNCHVLLALLHRQDKAKYLPQIIKTAKYLSNVWWDCDGEVKDKWHLSHLYPTMLLAQSFTDLLHQATEDSAMYAVFDSELLSKISICLFQACFRTLLRQEDDGSWNGQPEETSYAILTIAQATHLVVFRDLLPQIELAIRRGKAFLASGSWVVPDHYWTSKTAYRVAFVADAYQLAAAKISTIIVDNKPANVGQFLDLAPLLSRMDKHLETVRQTQFCASMPSWEVNASLVESALFVPLLRTRRLEVYDRDHMGVSKDTYLDLIPFTWILCNNRTRMFTSAEFLFEMMMISMLGYQTDEFVEAVAAPAFADSIGELHELIDSIFHAEITMLDHTDKEHWKQDFIRITLQRFIHYVLGHRNVGRASIRDQTTLRAELKAFLHAHAVQAQDNASRAIIHSPGRSFFEWVRTTAADHVACAYSFAFACCLISASIGTGHAAFPTVKENYLVQATTRHMATMCRMCNDFGSIDRDLAEGNTNSVDFPEFAGESSMAAKKKALAELADFERCCLFLSIDRLREEALQAQISSGLLFNFNIRKVEVVRFFADVTDLYDQLYLVRDLSSTMQQNSNGAHVSMH
ncbi:Ent-kaur-16-ene synthase [Pyrenochaeta sp. MPI-SDFR-AT-0127]|nr:Ent-kaur-16-ene synthase [Pyrenochaeta sp. MPI-SDFR-AT-0127]